MEVRTDIAEYTTKIAVFTLMCYFL